LPRRYTVAEKQEALRLLAIHNDNGPIVHSLSGILAPTLFRRRQVFLLKEPDLSVQKNIPPIEKHSNKKESPPPPDVPDFIRLARSRILDQVPQLDEILPNLDPEKVIRIAYVSDGMLYNVPHWADPALTSLKRKRAFSPCPQ